MPATPFAQANFIRRQLALAIRSRVCAGEPILPTPVLSQTTSPHPSPPPPKQSPKSVNLLLAGYDTGKEGDHLGPQLYFLDYLGTMAKV